MLTMTSLLAVTVWRRIRSSFLVILHDDTFENSMQVQISITMVLTTPVCQKKKGTLQQGTNFLWGAVQDMKSDKMAVQTKLYLGLM